MDAGTALFAFWMMTTRGPGALLQHRQKLGEKLEKEGEREGKGKGRGYESVKHRCWRGREARRTLYTL